jgi:hypothetical protein
LLRFPPCDGFCSRLVARITSCEHFLIGGSQIYINMNFSEVS